jgi:hypothetical protein
MVDRNQLSAAAASERATDDYKDTNRMSIAETDLTGQARRLGIHVREVRVALARWIKRAAFLLIKMLDPEFESVLGSAGATRPDGVAHANRPASASTLVGKAVVINDNNAVVTSETLAFYLRGIFSDEEAFNWSQALLAQDCSALTFEAIEGKLDQSLRELSAHGTDRRTALEWQRAFASHKETTALNRRAYSTANRTNPSAVYWPDPTLTDSSHPSAGRSLYTELPFARRIPLIDKSTRLVSAGSCFATEIAHALQRNHYNYVIKERNKGKPGSYEFLDSTSDLPNSSAAWGIIFNTPSFRQLVEKAFEVRALPRILWTQEILGQLRYLDPFRENIGFASPEAFEANYQAHIRAAREAFLEMDVFVITLGLNEVWSFKADGSVFARSPWRTAPSLVSYRTLTPQENVDELVRMTEILRAHNRGVQIICSLSPVALHATFRADQEHIVTANAHSKAVLRVAAEEFERRCPGVYYFPSFEMTTTSTEHPWDADQRHVSRATIENVMRLFHIMFGK